MNVYPVAFGTSIITDALRATEYYKIQFDSRREHYTCTTKEQKVGILASDSKT